MPPLLIPIALGTMTGVSIGALLGAKAAAPTVVEPSKTRISDGLIQLGIAVTAGIIVYRVSK